MKAVAYKRLFADLSKTEPAVDKDGPGLYSLHESSTVVEKPKFEFTDRVDVSQRVSFFPARNSI